MTETALLGLAAAIGTLADANPRFTDRVQRAVAALGGPEAITLAAFAQLIKRERETFNRIDHQERR
jgi:hypothetical protein